MQKNLTYVYSTNVILGLLGFSFIPLALHFIGVEKYGIYSIFIIITSFAGIVEYGVTKFFTRELARMQDSKEQINILRLSVGIYLKIAISVIIISPILITIIPAYIFPIEDNFFLVGLIAALSILDFLLSMPTTIVRMYNIGNEKFNLLSKYNLFSGISRHLTLIISLVVFQSLIILIITILLRRLFDLYYANKFMEKLPASAWKPIFIKGKFKEVINQSLYLSVSQLIQVSVVSIGAYLINKNYSLAELGVYKSSFDLASKIWFISNGLGIVLYPRFSALNANEDKKELVLNKVIKFTKVSWIIYNFIFIAAIIIVPYINFLLNIQNLYLFFLLFFGLCLNAHSNLNFEFLQSKGKFRLVSFLNLSIIFIIIFSFVLLNNRLGFITIGYSWLLSQLIYSFSIDFFVIKQKEYQKRKYLSLDLIVKVILIVVSVTIFRIYY
ncbi:oligosaccharide flippase family protein [Peribacillus frigoritolerans]|nr:oligosaccharide flippase family protein [Peribacillus frigoritolerans]